MHSWSYSSCFTRQKYKTVMYAMNTRSDLVRNIFQLVSILHWPKSVVATSMGLCLSTNKNSGNIQNRVGGWGVTCKGCLEKEKRLADTVQFKTVSMRLEKPIWLCPISHKFPQRCLWDGSNFYPTDDDPSRYTLADTLSNNQNATGSSGVEGGGGLQPITASCLFFSMPTMEDRNLQHSHIMQRESQKFKTFTTLMHFQLYMYLQKFKTYTSLMHFQLCMKSQCVYITRLI